MKYGALYIGEYYYGFISFINIVLMPLEFLVLSRRSWNVLCWGTHLSTGLADMLRQTLKCSSTQVYSSFDIPAEIFLPKVQKHFAQSPKTIIIKSKRDKKLFFSK